MQPSSKKQLDPNKALIDAQRVLAEPDLPLSLREGYEKIRNQAQTALELQAIARNKATPGKSTPS